MPRGGRRPGAGAPRGNTNALKSGENSERARKVAFAILNHPHRVEIVRMGLELGVIPPHRHLKARDVNQAKLVRALYPIIFDPNHPRHHEIAHPTRTERDAILACRALVAARGVPLIDSGQDNQKQSKTVIDNQTPEANGDARPMPTDSTAGKPRENEGQSKEPAP